MRWIAILGGTLDPIHNGHLKLAEEACLHFPLDACWFIPAVAPPHRQGRKLASYAQCLWIAELAAAPYEAFCVSGSEVKRRGLSYTSDTLVLLRETCPDYAFSLILGMGSFFQLEFRHVPTDTCRDACLPVAAQEYADRHMSLYGHAGHLRTLSGARTGLVPTPLIDISSMHIRVLFAADEKSVA